MQNLLINEGEVQIKVPPFEKISSQALVFYNPVMELNRDLSVLALKQFQEELDDNLRICDAFGGTGIRGIRYAREVPHVDKVVITDVNPYAVDLAQQNVEHNALKQVQVVRQDANLILRECGGKFNVVDIDPFGTPSPFIDSAAYNMPRKTLLAVTATDTSALCGTYPKPCRRKYRAQPLKNEYCHETGLRILAGFLVLSFSVYKKALTFRFAHSTEHYMRLYAQVDKGAKKADHNLSHMGYIAHCPHCLMRKVYLGLATPIPENCPQCDAPVKVGGPLWCGSLQDGGFVAGLISHSEDTLLNQKEKALKLLNIVLKESDFPPTFYDVHELSRKLKISAPSMERVFNQLEILGYSSSPTHFRPTAIKTRASLDVVEEAVLEALK